MSGKCVTLLLGLPSVGGLRGGGSLGAPSSPRSGKVRHRSCWLPTHLFLVPLNLLQAELHVLLSTFYVPRHVGHLPIRVEETRVKDVCNDNSRRCRRIDHRQMLHIDLIFGERGSETLRAA